MSAVDAERTPQETSPVEPWCSLAILAAVTVLALARGRPPPPRPIDAPPGEFSAERARASLARMIGDAAHPDGAPHPVGTEAHERVRERLIAEIEHIGLVPSVQEALVAGSHANVAFVRNVLARLPGRASTPAVLLAAHYDSVAAGPGAGDDGAGVAALLEVARALRAGPPLGHDVILLFTDGEELGLLGARAFCTEHPWARDASIALNLEGRGTCGPSEMFETGDDNARWMEIFARVVPRPAAVSLAYEVYKRMPNDTDMTVFKRAGMAGFNFGFIGGVRRYHTPLDDLAHLDPGSLQHHGDNALGLVRALSDGELPRASPGAVPERSVYADILGFAIVRWPESFAVPIALVELIVLFGAAFALHRSRRVRGRAVAAGIGLWLAVVLASAFFGVVLQSLIVAIGGTPEPWTGRMSAMAACLASGAACIAAIAASIARVRDIGREASWLGASIALALAGIASAIAVPGASYLFALPVAVATLVALALAFRPAIAPSAAGHALLSVPLAALSIVWIPLAIGLERAIEYRVSAANAATIGACLAGAIPLWIAARRRPLAFIASVSGIAALALGAWLACTAPGSADEPAHVNLARVVDADRGEERWLAATFGWPLASEVRERGGFDRVLPNPYPSWSYVPSVHETPARALTDSAGDRAPLGRVAPVDRAPLGRVASGDGVEPRHLALRSQRGARGIVVRAPEGIELRSVALRGRKLKLEHANALSIIGAGNEEIDVELAGATSSAASAFEISDWMRLERDEAGTLLDARSQSAIPSGEGDVSIFVRRVPLAR